MLTRAWVTLVQQELGALWTRTQILDAANRAQNEILGEPCALMRVRPDPFLTTVAGTYTYVASSSLYLSEGGVKGALAGDIRSVKSIYSYNVTAGIDTPLLDPSGSRPNYWEDEATRRRVWLTYDEEMSRAPNSSDCRIHIWPDNNPGTTTIDWRAVAFKWPTQLTSESVAITLPEEFQDTLLVYEVLKKAGRKEYGRFGQDLYSMSKESLNLFRRRYAHVKSDRRASNTPYRDI